MIPPEEVKMRVGDGLVGTSSLRLLTNLSSSNSMAASLSLIGCSGGAEPEMVILVTERDLGGAG